MPFRPAPITYSCPTCGWTKKVAPESDALRPGEYFDHCPACGHPKLTMRSAPIGQGFFAKLFAVMGRSH
jgi:predicted RNA-binding Zn-ribbon protein involved in translation (DUF1610 family)